MWGGAGPRLKPCGLYPQTSSRRVLEHYFHAVVAAVEQMAGEASPSRAGHLEKLEEIYCSLLGPAAARRGRCGSKRRVVWPRWGAWQEPDWPLGAPESSVVAAWNLRCNRRLWWPGPVEPCPYILNHVYQIRAPSQ